MQPTGVTGPAARRLTAMPGPRVASHGSAVPWREKVVDPHAAGPEGRIDEGGERSSFVDQLVLPAVTF